MNSVLKSCNFSEDRMEKVQSLLDTASGVLGFGGDPFATLVGSKVLNIFLSLLELHIFYGFDHVRP
jgi:hypothetical protein